MERYWVYILANTPHTTLYIGVTNNLIRRLQEHTDGFSAFTKKYNVKKLVHREEYTDIRDAIAREKQLKSWSRAQKIALIDDQNPLWKDLSS